MLDLIAALHLVFQNLLSTQLAISSNSFLEKLDKFFLKSFELQDLEPNRLVFFLKFSVAFLQRLNFCLKLFNE